MSERLREAAELFVKLAKDAGRDLAYDEAGVAWADEYVQAVRPVETEDQRRVQTALVGAFLGEALIAAYGGRWVEEGSERVVKLDSGARVPPFRWTEEHLLEGAGRSILARFRAAGDREQGTGDSQPETASADGSGRSGDDPAAPLRQAAERFAEVIAANGGPGEYGEAMVAFVDQFVENTRPVDAELLDHYTTLVGAVLGESIIAAYGGAWSCASGAWAVRFDPENEIYPFAKARKHLESGPEDSILSLFRTIPHVYADVLKRGEG